MSVSQSGIFANPDVHQAAVPEHCLRNSLSQSHCRESCSSYTDTQDGARNQRRQNGQDAQPCSAA